MKRKLPVILAILLVFALAGCTIPPSENLSAPAQATLLTREEAKTISLNHANATEAHITDFEIGLDEEDGVLVYEVGFDFDGAEYDYHIDAYSGKVIYRETERLAKTEAPAQTEAHTETPTEAPTKAKILVSPTSKKSIGLEAAKSAAFKHADVKSSKVQDLEVELDDERGSLQYEITFNAGSYEYEYHIDAYTGEVLHNEKEKDDDAKLSSSTTTLEKKKIGAAAAKNAAFKHAGVKAADAWDVEAELDTENGKLVYEVSFDAGGYEYDYDIDAYTGKVLRYEKERAD